MSDLEMPFSRLQDHVRRDHQMGTSHGYYADETLLRGWHSAQHAELPTPHRHGDVSVFLLADEVRRLVEYVNERESTICGEYCSDDWPACPSDRHADGREILALLGGRATALPD